MSETCSRSIVILCASHRGQTRLFAEFRALARQFDGVEDLMLVASGEVPREVAGKQPGEPALGGIFTCAPIRILDQVVGDLRVFLRPGAFLDTSPLPLTKFLAGQLGIALQASGIQGAHSALHKHRDRLEGEIVEHKLLERARGLIETRKLIPPGDGARLLKKATRQSGRNLTQLARGIVTAANKNPWKFRREFWA